MVLAVLTSSSSTTSNVRASSSPEALVSQAREAFLGGWIDVRELERRIGEALGVR